MKYVVCISAALLAFIAWGASSASFAGDARSITSVNGQVEAEPGETYDILSTVNG